MAVEALNQERSSVFFSQGRHGAGPFQPRPPVQLPEVTGHSPSGKMKVLSELPEAAAFRWWLSKGQQGRIPAWLYLKIWPKPLFLHQNLPDGFCLRQPFTIIVGLFLFLKEELKSLHRKNGSTTSLQVTGCAFFETGCALQAWTPSVGFPALGGEPVPRYVLGSVKSTGVWVVTAAA